MNEWSGMNELMNEWIGMNEVEWVNCNQWKHKSINALNELK